MRKGILCMVFFFASQMFAEIQDDNFELEQVYQFEEVSESAKKDSKVKKRRSNLN